MKKIQNAGGILHIRKPGEPLPETENESVEQETATTNPEGGTTSA